MSSNTIAPAGLADRPALSAVRVTPACARMWPAAAVAGIVLMACAVYLAAPTGWLGSDDAGYYAAGEHLRTGTTIERVHHHYARLPVVAAIGASTVVFGDNVVAAVLPSFLFTIGAIVLVAILGRLTVGLRAGLLAAMIVSLIPYVRLLSTAAYPDMYAAFWVTLAMVLAVTGVRRMRQRHDALPESAPARNASRATMLIALSCGLCVGVAISTKIFSGLVLLPILYLAVVEIRASWPQRAAWTATVGGGVLAVLIIEGLTYHFLSGDFLYHLRALKAAQTSDGLMSRGSPAAAGGWVSFIWHRLTMPLSPQVSGWGRLGVLFLPAAALGLMDRRVRVFAVWALGGYLIVAFAPVSLRDGYRAYPLFHGRHVLPLVVPSAICLAWLVREVLVRSTRPAWANRCWPALAAILALAAVTPTSSLAGQKKRDTARVGQAIEAMVAAGHFDQAKSILMTPSTYWRFRILFPPALRDRLCVAADPASPDWWEHTTVDMNRRVCTPAEVASACLLATPRQLAGEGEHWDYAVTLPPAVVAARRGALRLAIAVRNQDGTVTLADRTLPDRLNREEAEARAVLVLVDAAGRDALAGR